ncbi:hypothetical protein LLS1_18640 [Leifsonia sp. LS1]|uniref:hypothetical protein n=1 Tax=Leifsonia sp. LS1 TaxID=2828483 RepID=UPI001CFEAC1B|nr:hypothetical protein [Leifsonia sp. LS1]GIT80195.1 hypothetical protein LLS1_18640 [Leifsonia sp. LS1]
MTALFPGMPAEIKVGAVVYTVVTNPDEWVKIEHETQTKGFYGHTQNTPARIYINPDSAPDVARLTLWHEVIHALSETTMGAPDWRHLGKDRDAREESVIRKLEHPTLQVLRDNPDLVSYLAG